MKNLTEGDVTRQIRDVLNACKVWHFKHWSGPMTSLNGISDILGCRKVKVADLVKAGIEEVGIFMAIEVKKETWEPPSLNVKAYKHFKDQEDFLFQTRHEGGIGFFASSVEKVVEKLGLNVKL